MILIPVLQTLVTNLFQRNNSGNDSQDSFSDLRRIAKTAVLLLAAGTASFLLDWLQAPRLAAGSIGCRDCVCHKSRKSSTDLSSLFNYWTGSSWYVGYHPILLG